MFALLKREIEDRSGSYLLAVALSGVAVVLLLTARHSAQKGPVGFYLVLIGPILLGQLVLSSVLGASQIHLDRSRRISAFLCTLSVTRCRLFIAKVLAGVVLILVYLVPIMVVGTLVIPRITVPLPGVWMVYRDVCLCVLVLFLAAYSIGLAAGWLANRFNPAWLAPAPALLLIPLIVVKGPGWEGLGYIIVLAGACLVYSWRRFATASF